MIKSSVFMEQSSVWCALGWILKWNLTSLYHSPRTWARVLFPGPLRALTAAMFVQAEGDRGQEGTKSQGSRFDLESSILFSSHPLSGPCGVQVSFLEAFHSCSYFRIQKLGSSTPLGYLCFSKVALLWMKELQGRKTKETKRRAQSHSISDVIHLYPFAETGPFGSYSSLTKWRCSVLSHWAVGRHNRPACILQSHCHQCVILGN